MKNLMLAGLALMAFAVPALAQTSGAMQNEDKMASGAMSPRMTAAQARTAKRCAALSETARSKNAACRKLAQSQLESMMAHDDAMAPH